MPAATAAAAIVTCRRYRLAMFALYLHKCEGHDGPNDGYSDT